jgi:high-affinity iron transporter
MRRGAAIIGVSVALVIASVDIGGAQSAPPRVKALYEAKCATCHGATGAGDGPVAKALKEKPTNWTVDGGGLKGLTDQQIFDSIKRGGPAIGRARAMPAYNPSLSDAEISDLVSYVKALKR